MTSIDERIVAMSFDNRVFETNVAKTLQTLGKLDTTLQRVGSTTGFAEIDKAASRVTLGGATSAIDKLKTRLFGIGQGATGGFNDIERASQKVELRGLTDAADKAQAKLGRLSAGTTFTDIENASNKVSLQGLTNAIDNVSNKFSVLQGAAAVALGNITSQATVRAGAFVKGFSFGPIMQGLEEYETNLKSIQTIQANTDRPLPEINHALQELNKYSDQTIYNFSEMARNIGTFTAAGVDLKTATSSIKGIANLAALSGSSSQQAATAMYQLSQAISSGKVGLQDWNSVVNAGMGGKKLQNALAQTAIAMGKISPEAVKLEGPLKKLTINGKSFRESIMAKPGETPWLSSEILVNTLSTVDGRFSKAALAAEKTTDGLKKYTAAQIEAKIADNRAALEKKNGVKYTDAQFKALQLLSDSAFKSATEVKTLGQVFDVAKETIGSGWSASFQSIFGTLTEAKKTFTDLSGTINDFINANALIRNTVLHDWKELGGRTVMIEGIKQAFKDLFAILQPIGKAFREVFPRKSGKDLYDMSVRFRDLAEALKPTPELVDQIRRIFKGFFSILHIGQTAVKAVIGVIAKLFGFVGKNSGGFLEITASIGDFLVKVDEAISKGGSLNDIFRDLPGVLKTPLELLSNLKDAISSLFSGEGLDLGSKFVAGIHGARVELSPLEKIVLKVRDAFKSFKNQISAVTDFLSPVFSSAVNAVSAFGDKLTEAFENINYDDAVKALQTALTGGILLALRKLVGIGGGTFELKFFDNVKQNVVSTLDALTGSLKALQHNIQANTLLQIAVALGVLGAGIYLISKVDPKRIAPSMTAIAVGLGEMIGALKIMATGVGLKGVLMMPVMAASLVILAGGVILLAGAVALFSRLSWDELERGLVGVGGSLVAIKVGISGMGPVGAIAVSIIPLAIGIGILATAVKIFATMTWEDMEKGLIGVAGALRAISFGMKGMIGKQMLLIGPALIGVGGGLLVLAAAIAAFGSMDMVTLGKGLLAVGFAMQKLAFGLMLFPKGIFVQAAGIAVLAVALNGIALAVGVFGNLKISTLVKGIIAMGQALKVLAIGLVWMEGTLPGTAALLGAAFAFTLLVPALALMGNLKWSTIFKGLAGLALTLGVIAVAGLLAAPALTAIGFAMVALGLGVAAVSTGIYVLAKGIALIADAGPKGVTALIVAVGALAVAVPKAMIEFAKGLVEVIKAIAELAPKVVEAIGIIIGQIVAIIVLNAPKIAVAAGSIIDAILVVMVEKGPQIFDAGLKLFQHFLSGLAQNIGSITTKVGDIIIRFLNAMTSRAPQIIASGARLLLAWLNGFNQHVGDVINAAFRIVNTFLNTVAQNMPQFIQSGANLIVRFLDGIAREIPRIVRSGAHVIIAFLDGISKQFKPLADKATDVIVRFLRAISNEKNVARIVAEGFATLERFIRGITKGLRESKAIQKLLDAFFDLGKQLASSVLDGLGDIRDEIADRINPFYDGDEIERQAKVEEARMKKAMANSDRIRREREEKEKPNTRRGFKKVGEQAGEGYSEGITSKSPMMEKATREALRGSVKGAKKEIDSHSPSRVFMEIGRFIVEGMTIGIQGLPGELDKGIVNPLRTMIKIVGDQKKIARGLNKGFLKQILGIGDKEELSAAQSEVQTAFDNLKGVVKGAQDDLKAQIQKDEGKLKDLMSVEPEKRDQEAITKLFRAIGKNKELLKAARDATGEMFKGFSDEKAALLALADSYDAVLEKLQKVQEFIQSTTEQFNQLPDFDIGLDEALANLDLTAEEREEKRRERQKEAEKKARVDQVALYKKALEEQILATEKYNATLEKLRALGLDDTTYKKLLADGTKDQDFADQLLKGGAESIKQLNDLDAKLQKDAEDLAKNAADQLFAAGVHTAEGLVEGLKSQAAAIKAIMNGIAQDMVNTIKTQLKIKSPSRVFAQLGAFTTQGFADGLRGSTRAVTDAAANIGDEATTAMAESLRQVSDSLSSEIDSDITIRPVLDLSNVEDGAKKMSGLLGDNVVPITAAASYGQAASISDETMETQAAHAEAAANSTAPTVIFEQNNMSPDKLSEIEIYRQTSNQLSKLKSVLPGLAGA